MMMEKNQQSKICKHVRQLIIPVVVIVLMASFNLYAQMSARGLGMGGAYTALARGVHAPMWNPANLGLPDNSRFSMTIVSVETGVWNNSFSFDMYNKYNGKHLTSQDIDDILSHIPDKGFGLDSDVFVRTLSFSAGRFALSIGSDASTMLRMDKTFFEIPLAGTEINERYTFDNTDGRGLGVGVAGFSFGQPLAVDFADAFSAGLTVKFLFGGGYGQTDKTELFIDSKSYGLDLDGEYKATYAYLGGLGWGIDLGAAAQFGPKWTVSAGLFNLISSVPFKDNIETVQGNIHMDSLSVISDFEEDFQDTSWTKNGAAFNAKLPTVLKIGCAFQEENVVVTADYCQGFVNGPFVSTNPRFAMGTEWRGISWLPLRFGFILGGRIGFGSSFGFGIRPGGFVLDLAVMNRGFISPMGSKGAIVALEIGVNLQKKEPGTVRVGDY